MPSSPHISQWRRQHVGGARRIGGARYDPGGMLCQALLDPCRKPGPKAAKKAVLYSDLPRYRSAAFRHLTKLKGASAKLHKSVKNGQLKKRASYGRIKTSTIGGILYAQRISTHTRLRKRNI